MVELEIFGPHANMAQSPPCQEINQNCIKEFKKNQKNTLFSLYYTLRDNNIKVQKNMINTIVKIVSSLPMHLQNH